MCPWVSCLVMKVLEYYLYTTTFNSNSCIKQCWTDTWGWSSEIVGLPWRKTFPTPCALSSQSCFGEELEILLGKAAFTKNPVKLKSCVYIYIYIIVLAFKVSICPQATPVEEMVDHEDIHLLHQLNFTMWIFLLICNIRTPFPPKWEDEVAAEDPYNATEEARLLVWHEKGTSTILARAKSS